MGDIADYHVNQYASGRWGMPRSNKGKGSDFYMTTKNTDTKVITGEVRFSYAHVFEPHAMDDNQEAKYSVCLLIPKEDKETVKAIEEAIEAAKAQGKAQWGGKVPPSLKTPLRDGDEERDQEEYKGHYFINANSKQKPGVVKPAGKKTVEQITDTEEFYSGCYGKASVNFYPFAVSGNKGIAAGLNNVIKLRDGDYLGGRASAEDDFSDMDFDVEDGGDDFLG